MQSNKPKKGNKLILPLSILAVLVIALLVLFIPFNNRTALAAMLDAGGQHRAAMGVDMLYANQASEILKAVTLNDLSSNDQCATAYKLITREKIQLQAISGKATTKITSVNPNYADKFSLQTDFSGSVNPDTRQASASVNMQGKVDPTLVNEISKELGAGESKQSLNNFEFSADSIFNPDEMLFTISKLNLKSSDFNSQNSLNNYYKVDLKNKDAQKEALRQEGIDELTTELKKVLDFKLEDVMEEETFKQYIQLNCSQIDKVEVKAPETKTFDGREMSVRPIVTSLKANSEELYIEQMPKLLAQTQKDQKLRTFLNSKYENVVKMSNAGNKIVPEYETTDYNAEPLCEYYDPQTFESNPDCTYDKRYPKTKKIAFTVPTKEEYTQQIERLLSGKNSDGVVYSVEDAKKALEQQKEYYSIQAEPSTTYLDMTSGELAAMQSTGKLIFTDKALENFKSSPTAQTILKDGLKVESLYYGINFGSNVKDVPLPSNVKPAESFGQDLQNTDAAQKLAPKTSTTSSSNNLQTI